MESIKVLKTALRKEIKQKLLKLTEEQKQYQSKIIVNKLLSLKNYQDSSRVSVYLSTDNEVDTRSIVRHLFENKKQCFIPRYNGDMMEMVKLYSLQDFENLPLTKWNIKQPDVNESRENALDTGGLDLIIVPGVAFTKDGDRMGHGKGYYDRFFHTCFQLQQDKRPKTVALAFNEQIVDSLPTHQHDVKIDHVLYSE